MAQSKELVLINSEVPEEEEDWIELDHKKAKLTAVDADKGKKSGAIGYTIVLQDELNLKQPIMFDLYINPDGSIACDSHPNATASFIEAVLEPD